MLDISVLLSFAGGAGGGCERFETKVDGTNCPNATGMSLCKTIVPASEIPDSVGVPVCLVRPGPEADDSTRVPRDGKGSPADALAAALEA